MEEPSWTTAWEAYTYAQQRHHRLHITSVTLKKREDWEKIKPFFDPDTPGHFPLNWDEVAEGYKGTRLSLHLTMQRIKGSSTLRVSPKDDKSSPRIVFRYGEQSNQIKEFLVERRRIKNTWGKAEIDLSKKIE